MVAAPARAGRQAAIADIARCQHLRALQLSEWALDILDSEEDEEGTWADALLMMAEAGFSMRQVRCLRLGIATGHKSTYLFDSRIWLALPPVFCGIERLEIDAGGCFLGDAFRDSVAQLPELRTLSVINVPEMSMHWQHKSWPPCRFYSGLSWHSGGSTGTAGCLKRPMQTMLAVL